MQISSEESSSRKSSTESREFWEETTQLLQDLAILREDVEEIECPCNKPGCPFQHRDRRGGGRGERAARTARVSGSSRRNTSLRNRANSEGVNGLMRTNLVSLLVKQRQQQQNKLCAARVHPGRDTQVTEEPLAGLLGQTNFVRGAPWRKAQRRNSIALRASNSCPTATSSLAVPCIVDLRPERWCSLPSGMESVVGSSLDSLDCEKLHDIQKSFLRRQRMHMSSGELDQW